MGISFPKMQGSKIKYVGVIKVALYKQSLLLHSAHTRYQLFGCYTKSTLHNIPIGFKIFSITDSYL